MSSNTPSAPKPAIFMHIQKTAGSSVVHMARAYYGNENVSSHGDHLNGFTDFPLKDKFFSHERTTAEFGHLPFISGHFGYDFAKPFMQQRYSFTFLRDPIERILSFYYFCKSRDPEEYSIYKLVQSLTLDEFLQRGLEASDAKACIWNTQTWQLANGYGNSNGRNINSIPPDEILALALEHLNEFSYIGFAETFEKDRDHILRALNITPPTEKIVTNANHGRPMTKDMSPSTLALLHELTQLDRVVYQAAWSKNKSFFGKYIRPWLPNK